MIILGITGSLGSGKTTVGRIFRHHGAHLIDADQIVREMQSPHTLLLGRIRRQFGSEVISQDGNLNRPLMGKLVFSDEGKRKKLNELIHPHVRRHEAALIENFNDYPVVILDIPLLFENYLHRLLPMTAVITVSEIERERRLVQQRGMSRIDIQKRLKTQMPQKEKIALADFIIDNSGTLEATQQQVEDLFNRLKSMNTIMIKRSIETYNPFTPFKRGESA